MADSGPLFGDIAKAKMAPTTLEGVNWAEGDFSEGGEWVTIDGWPRYVPNLGYTGDVGQGIQEGLSYEDIDWSDTEYLMPGQGQDPLFALFYNTFLPPEYQGEVVSGQIGFDQNHAAAADWWKHYGKYFDEYAPHKEIMTKRKGALDAEKWRIDNLKTFDKMGGYVGKTKFAGDSQYVKATEDLLENAIRTKDLQTLGVNASLWQMRDNHLANAYSMFGQLAGTGAYDEGGYLDYWDPDDV